MTDTEITTLKLLTLFDRMNRDIKSEAVSQKDISEFYSLKNDFLLSLLKHKPWNMIIRLHYIPYFRHSTETGNKDGEQIRDNGIKKTLEYNVAQTPPAENEPEIKGGAVIEMEIDYFDIQFSFHIPAEKAKKMNIDISNLPQKTWISDNEHQKNRFLKFKEEVSSFLEKMH